MTRFSIARAAFALRTGFAAVLVLISSAAAYAQGCSLCYTQAAGSGHRFIQALRTGILVLIVPPMFMSVGITILAYKKRNRTVDRNSEKSDRDW